MRRFLFWLVWNVPLGPLAPFVLGLAVGADPELCDRRPET